MNSAGRFKISDLGMAQLLTHLNLEALTRQNEDLCYHPPELLQPHLENGSLSDLRSADIFALGVIAWERI